MVIVLIVIGVCKIFVQFVKCMVGCGIGNILVVGVCDYILLKVNVVGVMFIIFVQVLMFLLGLVVQIAGVDVEISWLVQKLNDFIFGFYNVIYFVLVVVFIYVYMVLIVNFFNYVDYLKCQNVFIFGVKFGKLIEEFIDLVIIRIILFGFVFFGLIVIMLVFVVVFGINNLFVVFFGGIFLLILVGVVLDILQ